MGWQAGQYVREAPDNHTGPTAWQLEEAAGENIDSDRHDYHDQDMANGISACLNLDGENSMNTSLDMGTNQIINLLDGVAPTDAVTKQQLDAAGLLPAGTLDGQMIRYNLTGTTWEASDSLTNVGGNLKLFQLNGMSSIEIESDDEDAFLIINSGSGANIDPYIEFQRADAVGFRNRYDASLGAFVVSYGVAGPDQGDRFAVYQGGYANAASTSTPNDLTLTTKSYVDTQVSDARVKENVRPVEGALEAVLAMNAVQYDYIPEASHFVRRAHQKDRYGLLAQEVEKVLPDAVSRFESPDGEELYSLDYGELVPVLIEAIKELAGKVKQ